MYSSRFRVFLTSDDFGTIPKDVRMHPLIWIGLVWLARCGIVICRKFSSELKTLKIFMLVYRLCLFASTPQI